jgi:cyclophilin family peptidyl-prolyl cis-trans isomerase
MVLSCGGSNTKTKDFDAPSEEDVALDAKVKKGVKAVADNEVAVIETSDFGQIVIELYPNLAPLMVERFKKLIREGFYNGTTFHRIDPMTGIIQGGDPLSKDNDPDNDGQGDSPYPNVPGEMSDVPFERGVVAAARRGANEEMGISEAQARDTANCQFFISTKRQPQYDRSYTLFGRVIQGMTAVDAIAGAPTAPGNNERPADKIVIKSITLQPRSKY